MEEYKVIPNEPLVKIESEVEELKNFLKELEHKEKDNEVIIKDVEKSKEEPSSIPSQTSEEDLFRELIKYARVNQEIINSIVVSNLELQTKLSETIVSLNELTKEIRKLIDIFKEAAMQYVVEGGEEEKTRGRERGALSEEKLSILEKQNNKIIELLSNIQKTLEESKSSKKHMTPPVIPPQAPFPFMPKK